MCRPDHEAAGPFQSEVGFHDLQHLIAEFPLVDGKIERLAGFVVEKMFPERR